MAADLLTGVKPNVVHHICLRQLKKQR